eukprot:CAMPEP_0172323010 /NCGR_PEP_ID=MMETSP1058-20130122/47576_1 /TAXON_ID=83371 /ORGANISM="Detonula confervacea, Strain CCMP 353" /LENGTH=439 /DNA_ID=CAMNT_0013038909 /DNA_START=35 /DNA_END=1351 /DNA_ORIENTATION=-
MTAVDTTSSAVDTPFILSRIAFGSCHSRGALSKRMSKSNATESPTIWDSIASTVKPQTFLWTGDSIYPPTKSKGDAPLDVMQKEYQQMLHNKTLGYAQFLQEDDILIGGVHGTWDDHDYGGNDRGRELKEREERRDAYLDFLDVPKDSERWERKGVYGSIEFGEDISIDNDSNHLHDERSNNKVKVIFLDTRFHREKHCVPSVGSNPYVPYGALIACTTRWITAGLDLPSILPSWTSCSNDSELLGEDQWKWLEQQLNESNASMHVVVSSIQVLTTNPVVESWGHFPTERDRFLKLLNTVPGLVILSGDVHHAEISSTTQRNNSMAAANKGALVEVTSSGLTHSCDEPFYGPLCKPILDAFPTHRFKGGNVKDQSAPSYFTSRNFGSIDIDWVSRLFRVHVHDDAGDVVLSAGFEMDTVAGMSDEDIMDVAKCIDGHIW